MTTNAPNFHIFPAKVDSKSLYLLSWCVNINLVFFIVYFVLTFVAFNGTNQEKMHFELRNIKENAQELAT